MKINKRKTRVICPFCGHEWVTVKNIGDDVICRQCRKKTPFDVAKKIYSEESQKKKLLACQGCGHEYYSVEEDNTIVCKKCGEIATINKASEIFKETIKEDVVYSPMQDLKILDLIIRKNRFYVRVQNKIGKIETIPRANFVWLISNPSFKEIPKGYVVHHLDHDPTNDDRSNLVIMQRHLHTAYHWKNKNISYEVKLDESEVYFPTKRPRYYYHKPAKRYFIQFYEKGKGCNRVWRKNNKPLLTENEAAEFANEIWEKFGDKD